MMRIKPILFNGEMVRAILEGRKTQTRRVMKVQPPDDRYTLCQLMCSTDKELTKHKYKHHWCIVSKDKLDIEECGDKYFNLPYGYNGDQLWVRETFVIESNYQVDSQDNYPPPFNDGRPIKQIDENDYEDSYWQQCHYRATDDEPELHYSDLQDPYCRWKPSIFMPRWASRIQLKVTNVRVERVGDISEEDSLKEGIKTIRFPNGDVAAYKSDYKNTCYEYPKLAFEALWDSINKKRGFGWYKNPWVWVIEFERMK